MKLSEEIDTDVWEREHERGWWWGGGGRDGYGYQMFDSAAVGGR